MPVVFFYLSTHLSCEFRVHRAGSQLININFVVSYYLALTTTAFFFPSSVGHSWTTPGEKHFWSLTAASPVTSYIATTVITVTGKQNFSLHLVDRYLGQEAVEGGGDGRELGVVPADSLTKPANKSN